MKWSFKAPASGDMLRVKMPNGLYHYGVYVSDTEIIQFGLAPTARVGVKDSDVEVCVSDIDGFLSGGFLEVGEPEKAEKKKLRAAQEIVATARERLGEKGYNILYNNCEHFAYECVLGEKYSAQTEDLRAFFRALPLVDVYVAEIPQDTELSSIYPPQRETEIAACKSEKAKREKYYVWKLLEYALERSFGYKMKKQTFTKNACGKWECENCFFSLSHSKNAVAVAVSRKNVGVDIEFYEPDRLSGFAEKILNAGEKALYEAEPQETRAEFLLCKWTEKESVFKTLALSGCKMASVDTLSAKTKTKFVEIKGERYCLSVASENAEKARYFSNIDLTKG